MDFIGDIGGVLDVLIALVGIFMFNYNDHNFNVQKMKLLYKIKPTEELFEGQSKI